MTASMAQDPPVPRNAPTLLTIPPEIRAQIFGLLLNPHANRLHLQDEYTSYSFSTLIPLLLTSRQIHAEAKHAFYTLNTFVRIETPWQEAQQHVEIEGHVPILIRGEQALRFDGWTLGVGIDAPLHSMLDLEVQRFVVLVDDIDKFCRMWFYADLSHPGLNAHLRLTLRLRDHAAPADEEKVIPKVLQRRLLLPFGQVKSLRETVVAGNPKPCESIVSELREAQATPHSSPESCLRAATKYKAEGNVFLTSDKPEPRKALDCYVKAWEAMHIVIRGRQRHIHADAFFGKEMVEEPYKGKNGQSERLILRVQLVANTCLAYLKLENWRECRFWGMRSINMLREAMGVDERHEIEPADEAVLGFPARDQMGKIYYRTAVASKEMGDRYEARRLLRVAEIYLPHDESIKKEFQGTMLQI